jgi:hypothetical protein
LFLCFVFLWCWELNWGLVCTRQGIHHGATSQPFICVVLKEMYFSYFQGTLCHLRMCFHQHRYGGQLPCVFYNFFISKTWLSYITITKQVKRIVFIFLFVRKRVLYIYLFIYLQYWHSFLTRMKKICSSHTFVNSCKMDHLSSTIAIIHLIMPKFIHFTTNKHD